MFDYFFEVTQFLSQGATVVNTFLGHLYDVISYVSNNADYQIFQTVINQFPADIAVICTTVIAASFFDFIRGR